MLIELLKNKIKDKVKFKKLVILALIALNIVGMVINSVCYGISNTFNQTELLFVCLTSIISSLSDLIRSR